MTDMSDLKPFDVMAWRQGAIQYPAVALESFADMIQMAKDNNSTVFLQAWDEAFRHYEGAIPDELDHHIASLQGAFVMLDLPVVNAMPVPAIRNVDENGVGELGDEYRDEAAPELIERGLAFNLPVLLRYPDRHLEEGNEVRFTETAVEMLEADLKASFLPEDQWRRH